MSAPAGRIDIVHLTDPQDGEPYHLAVTALDFLPDGWVSYVEVDTDGTLGHRWCVPAHRIVAIDRGPAPE